MTSIRRLWLGLLFSACASACPAQAVAGNEAVRSGLAGARVVELAPLPAGMRQGSEPCRADSSCHAGSWYMVETPNGLMECTEPYARPGTCRASSYGSIKRARLWLVKSKGQWLHCQFPDLASRCVPLFARPPANLPYDAVQ